MEKDFREMAKPLHSPHNAFYPPHHSEHACGFVLNLYIFLPLTTVFFVWICFPCHLIGQRQLDVLTEEFPFISITLSLQPTPQTSNILAYFKLKNNLGHMEFMGLLCNEHKLQTISFSLLLSLY